MNTIDNYLYLSEKMILKIIKNRKKSNKNSNTCEFHILSQIIHVETAKYENFVGEKNNNRSQKVSKKSRFHCQNNLKFNVFIIETKNKKCSLFV